MSTNENRRAAWRARFTFRRAALFAVMGALLVLSGCNDDDDSAPCESDSDCVRGTCTDGQCLVPIPGDGSDGDADGGDDGDGATAPFCGDGLCNGDETAKGCYADCGSCGDGFCTSGEEDASSCPQDCANCGDSVCDDDESAETCYADCGSCGDGICTAGEEDDTSCYEDCGSCGDLICQDEESAETCAVDCGTTTFRTDGLAIASPAFYTDVLSGFCDYFSPTINAIIGDLVVKDGVLSDADGFYDLSLIQLFRPYSAQAEGQLSGAFGVADCSFVAEDAEPGTLSMCAPSTDGAGSPITPIVMTYAVKATGTCADPLPGNPPDDVSPPAAPCYATEQLTASVNLLGINITLQDAVVAATVDDIDAPTALTNGVIAGFLTLETARAIVFPAGTPLVGDMNLAELLDGPDSCQEDGPTVDELAVGPNDQPGWWFYLPFSGEPAEWTPAD